MKRSIATMTVALLALGACPIPAGAQDAPKPQRVFVPYRDLAALVSPADRAVLMNRAEFEKLLAAAGPLRADAPPLGQIISANYNATADDSRLTLSGELTVVSTSDDPVAVPLGIGGAALTDARLDGKPAPLGYDAGRLVLIVAGKGEHRLTLSAAGRVSNAARGGNNSAPAGGSQFSLSLPPAVAGSFKLTAPGDLDIFASAPVVRRDYDADADRTTAELAVGGIATLGVVTSGNGRADDQQAIMLADTVATVTLTPSFQTLSATVSVQVLRRGVRELSFTLPAEWTVSDVACPEMVRWSVQQPDGLGPQRLTIALAGSTRGVKSIHIQASAPTGDPSNWRAPRLGLVDADYQRGYLLVDTGRLLRIRGRDLADARQEDLAAAARVVALPVLPNAQLFAHWGDGWRVALDLATLQLRRSVDARQVFTVAPRQDIRLSARFEVTPIAREMFEFTIALPPADSGWQLGSIDVPNQRFEYRLRDTDAGRLLVVELATPVPPDGLAAFNVALTRAGLGWRWDDAAGNRAPRDLALPLLRPQADTLSSIVAVAGGGDIEVEAVRPPAGMSPVPVGRMARLGLSRQVRLAWRSEDAAQLPENLAVRVSRLEPTVSAAAVGLVHVEPEQLVGRWQIVYRIERASTAGLYLLIDKQLGSRHSITTPGRRLASSVRVEPGPDTLALPPALADRYNLYRLTLESPATGDVPVAVTWTTSVQSKDAEREGRGDAGTTTTQHADADAVSPRPAVAVPLVRPAGVESADEVLALSASDRLAVEPWAALAEPIDAIDVPALAEGGAARRMIAVWRLAGVQSPKGPGVRVDLGVRVHDAYEIPSAMVNRVAVTTVLGADGSQQTRVHLRMVNAGLQSLRFRLGSEAAELWSARVSGQQAKPGRQGAADYVVALPRSRRPFLVEIVFTAPAGDGALVGIQLPDPRVKVNQVKWEVLPPVGRRIASADTTMSTWEPLTPRPAFRRAFGFLDDLFGEGMMLTAIVDTRQTAYDASAPTGDEDRYAGEAPPARDASDDSESMSELPPYEEGLLHSATLPSGRPERLPAPSPTPPPSPQWHIQATEGRYTLPVDIDTGGRSGVEFSSIGLPAPGALRVEVASRLAGHTWTGLGALAMGLVGLLSLRRSGRFKGLLVLLAATAASLVALWLPPLAHVANGVFWGTLGLIPFYAAIAILAWVVRNIRRALRPAVAAGACRGDTAARVIVLLATLLAGATAEAAPPADTADTVVLPYAGDPTGVDPSADDARVLVPYARYVELWNRAHPDQKLSAPAPAGGVALADVRYAARLDGERFALTLSATVRTLGSAPATMPLHFGNLAVTRATLDGEPAALQVGPEGQVLTLPARAAAGRLVVEAVTTAQTAGRKGSVTVSLPPLPGATMAVDLGDAGLVLDADGIEAAPAKADAGQWVVPLGDARRVSLRWSPQAGGGAADQTLQAESNHDVFVFHWGLVGVSRVSFRFGGGQRDRFALAVPAGASITDVAAANLRDFQVVGDKQIDAAQFQIIAVRLHRPASKQVDMTLRWVAGLPKLDESVRLSLPRAGDVARESGRVALSAAGGMDVQVARIVGGRRVGGAESATADVAGVTAPVARIEWPYRPFSLHLQLARRQGRVVVALNQLVRLNPDNVELLTEASLKLGRPELAGGHNAAGRLFHAAFALPDGYELIGVTGEHVWDWYVQSREGAPRLAHVTFGDGVPATKVVLVLARKDVDFTADAAEPRAFSVPTVAPAMPVDRVTGRLGVQVAPALSAHTLASTHLRSIRPQALRPWLGELAETVQFPFDHDRPDIALTLGVKARPSRVRVEALTGVAVHPTVAAYTYRLRYTIEGSPVDRVRFTLPAEFAGRATVGAPAGMIRSVRKSEVEAPGQTEPVTRFDVALVSEVTGVLDIVVNFAVPIHAETGTLAVPQLLPEAREGYRQVVAVQNMSRHELKAPQNPPGLDPMPLSEQRRVLTNEAVRQSLQLAYQNTAERWSLVLGVTPAAAGADAPGRIGAIVDLLAMTTVIDRNGQCRYEVVLDLHNRSEQFLRLSVPEPLKLWSASVADEPVKPVTDKSRPGEVLIPLVRTEPGGLPYQVKIYLAGQAVGPLEGMTTLTPPALKVVDVPVQRTIWSLRLPPGFRYVRPQEVMRDGGNMTPLAAEALASVATAEALLGQYQRYESALNETVSWSYQSRVADNFETMNKKLDVVVADAERKLETARQSGDLDEQAYRFNREKLKDISNTQHALLSKQQEARESQETRLRNNINGLLNDSCVNPGLSEADRNAALNRMPEFLASAEQQRQVRQRERLGRIEESLKQAARPAGPPATVQADSTLLAGEGDVEAGAKAAEQLSRLQGEREYLHRQLKQQQEQIHQLQQLSVDDNRAQRYYAGKAGNMPANQPLVGNEPHSPTVTLDASSGQARAGQLGQGQSWADAQGQGMYQAPGQPAQPGTPAGREVASGPVSSARTYHAEPVGGTNRDGEVLRFGNVIRPTGAAGGEAGAAVRGLPVELPDGYVQMDFTGPGKNVELVLYAVPDRTLDRGRATVMVLGGLIVLLILWALLAGMRRRSKLAGRGIAVLVVLGLLLGLLFGVGGLVVWLIIAAAMVLVARARAMLAR